MVMAQHRQSGADRLSVRVQNDAADRIPYRPARIRRPGKAARRPSPAALAAALALVLFISLVASGRIISSRKGFRRDLGKDDDGKDELGLNESAHWKELKFGHDSDKTGRDSRFRDEDDRRRGGNYREEDLPNEQHRAENYRFLEKGWRLKERIPVEHPPDKVNEKRSRKAVARLYNEGGRAELDYYKEEYEASVKDDYELKQGNETTEDNFDEYDDGIDALDTHDKIHDDVVPRRLDDSDGGESKNDASLVKHEKYSAQIQAGPAGDLNSKNVQDRMGSETAKSSAPEKKSVSKKRPHRTSCEINFLNSTAQLVEPLIGKKFAKFSLQYTQVENMPNGSENWEPRFAGHQTLEEREKSFYAHDQTVNCGFIKGPSGSPSTGFDIAEEDLNFMSSCHIAVSSCIFGNSDHLRTPFTKTITQLSRKNVCFVMFLDEITLETLLSEGQKFENGLIGMWRLVVIKKFPYTDMRRVGKIPKFLAHRLFPSSRYSIWLDSKLRLQSDPYLILEYFLWRRGYEYAISNHYDRHCVWDEVMQNKKLNKYNHTVIDQQFEFYQSDGLKRFNPSDPKKLLPSYVPEGSFIVRAHTPMSNLFSCLWFNEVDRFTSRDQLSFAYTYLKLRRMNPGKPFFLNMFKDCERRAMAKLFHHRSEEKRIVPTQSAR